MSPTQGSVSQNEPEMVLRTVITFENQAVQRAFADWVASGECLKQLWWWMGRHGYHI